jgi:hypothetical protein
MVKHQSRLKAWDGGQLLLHPRVVPPLAAPGVDDLMLARGQDKNEAARSDSEAVAPGRRSSFSLSVSQDSSSSCCDLSTSALYAGAVAGSVARG